MPVGGTKVGTAYVEVTPKAASNFKSAIEKSMPSGDKSGSKFGKGFSDGAKSTISAGAVAMGNIMSSAIEKGVSGLGSVLSDAVNGFADFQQLSGGVEKLFGEDAAQTVMQNAQRAFETAGMSANQYMEQATSFSAALINSLGGDTQKAAEMTDVAMRAMSDNVNTFGSDMGDVQNAFQGFAKQNYTMLDNLKLGYGGTKSEMERLIADANEYAAANGMAADLTIDSYADVIQAIQLVQEKQGVAGTTAKEAASTVSGSISMMQSAWQNWLAALGSGQDMTGVTEQLFGSVQTVLDNLGPVLQNVLTALVQAAPMFLQGAIQMFSGLLQGLAQTAPQLTAQIPAMVGQLVTTLVANLPGMISGALQLFLGIATGLVQAIPVVISTLIQSIPMLVRQVAAAAPQMLQAGKQFFNAIGQALGQVVPMLGEALLYVITHLPEIVVNGIGGMLDAGAQLFGSLVDGIMGAEPDVDTAASNAASGAVDAAFASSDASAVGENLTNTMMANFDFGTVETAAAEGAEGAVDAAAAVDATQVGMEFSQAAASGIDVSAMTGPAAEMAASASSSLGDMSGAASSAATAFQDFASMVEKAMSQAQRAADSAASRIRSSISSIPSSKNVYVNVLRGSVVLPHFSMYGDFDPKTKSVPHVSVSWYAKGGIFTQPAIIGVGEGREPEGVFPLSKLESLMGGGGVRDVNVYLDYKAGEDASRLARDVARRLDTILNTEA